MTTKNSFLETTWKQTSQNNNSDVFDIAQKNSVSITLAELLLSRKVDSIKSFLSSKLKDNLSLSKIEKLSSNILYTQIKNVKGVKGRAGAVLHKHSKKILIYFKNDWNKLVMLVE